MTAQLKYALRNNISQRLTGLLITLVINLGFLLAWQMGARHPAVQVVGIALSGLSLTAIFVVSIIADMATVRDVFGSPNGYSLMLAPVPGWKILFGRIISIVICDAVSYAVAIPGVVAQALLMSGMRDISSKMTPYVFLAVIVFTAGYLLVINAIFFSEAIKSSVLHTTRGRGPISVIITCLLLYIMSFANLILIPFADVLRYGPYISLVLAVGFNTGTMLSIVITLAQSVVLFILTASAIERKVNL